MNSDLCISMKSRISSDCVVHSDSRVALLYVLKKGFQAALVVFMNAPQSGSDVRAPMVATEVECLFPCLLWESSQLSFPVLFIFFRLVVFCFFEVHMNFCVNFYVNAYLGYNAEVCV